MKIEIEAKALKQAPVWEAHKRGKNWFAKIAIDPTAPGGLRRDFASKARGDFTYLVPSWMTVGMPVEFGADYYSGSGRKQADRWYGVVRAVSDTEVEFEKFGTAREAIDAAKKPVMEGSGKEFDYPKPEGA